MVPWAGYRHLVQEAAALLDDRVDCSLLLLVVVVLANTTGKQ